MQDMGAQLCDRYLRNSECRTGLYLVGHFMAERWDPDDWRRAKSDAIEIKHLEDAARGAGFGIIGRRAYREVRIGRLFELH